MPYQHHQASQDISILTSLIQSFPQHPQPSHIITILPIPAPSFLEHNQSSQNLTKFSTPALSFPQHHQPSHTIVILPFLHQVHFSHSTIILLQTSLCFPHMLYFSHSTIILVIPSLYFQHQLHFWGAPSDFSQQLHLSQQYFSHSSISPRVLSAYHTITIIPTPAPSIPQHHQPSLAITKIPTLAQYFQQHSQSSQTITILPTPAPSAPRAASAFSHHHYTVLPYFIPRG